jgi:hypothetical protein
MINTTKPKLLLNAEELATQLGVKRSWVYANADALGAYRLGKYVRFDLPRVLERLEKGISSDRFNPPTQRPSPTDTNKIASNMQGTTREQNNKNN